MSDWPSIFASVVRNAASKSGLSERVGAFDGGGWIWIWRYAPKLQDAGRVGEARIRACPDSLNEGLQVEVSAAAWLEDQREVAASRVIAGQFVRYDDLDSKSEVLTENLAASLAEAWAASQAFTHKLSELRLSRAELVEDLKRRNLLQGEAHCPLPRDPSPTASSFALSHTCFLRWASVAGVSGGGGFSCPAGRDIPLSVVGCRWAGQGVAGFEREKMLSGQAARMVFYDLYSVDANLGGMLPATLDGAVPPAGTRAVFAEMDDSAWGTRRISSRCGRSGSTGRRARCPSRASRRRSRS